MSQESATGQEAHVRKTAERIARAQARIEEAVAAIQSGEAWRDYLNLQSRLHCYSGNNSILIAVQHAEAYQQGLVATAWPTYVAGFHTWKALGRIVDRGQHGYQILAPNRHTTRIATDADGGQRTLNRGESPDPAEAVESRQVIRGFRIEHVFAAEQTSGNDIPAPPTPTLLTGQAPVGLWDNVVSQIEALGYSVRLVASASDLGGANGQTSWASKLVEIRADMDDAARTKTALHELAHCLLHSPPTLASTYKNTVLPSRGAKEVEAESVAFIVADAHGMATDDYSFPYVTAWAGTNGTTTVRAALSRVAATAHQIIAASDSEHTSGGRVPGVEPALAARRTATTTAEYAGLPPPAAGLGIEGVA